jgi:uroporphyrinogen-III synthase
MNDSRFTHVLLTRPAEQSAELAAMVTELCAEPIVLPAFDFLAVDAGREQAAEFAALCACAPADLVVFTSPRAVRHGLSQLPPGSLSSARVAAVGPSTAAELQQAGVRVDIVPARGFTSEALLEVLSGGPGLAPETPRAFIIAAPGGRDALSRGLGELGWETGKVMVYRSEPAQLDREQVEALAGAGALLSVWTSGNAMKSLSQRLPPAAWFKVCQGEWLVISERLQRLARAWGPPRIHLAAGPDNASIARAIRALG